MIRDATEHDAPAIAAVYNPYITELLTSFEKDPLSDSAMADRVRGIQAGYPWLVYVADGEILVTRALEERHATLLLRGNRITARAVRGAGSVTALRGCSGECRITSFRSPSPVALPNAAALAHEKFPASGRCGGFDGGQWIDIGFGRRRRRR